ncbi:MAG TPA: glycosyltransferase family 2 protein [Thermoanaerobaculia bacterium]
MRFLDEVTPVILTRDEEANIARTLGQLAWAREVLIVDSLSTDATVAIAQTFPNVRIVKREIDTLAGQTAFGFEQASTPWVLLLDADYFVPFAIAEELQALEPAAEDAAWKAEFTYAMQGRPLRGSLYPARIVLLRKSAATVWQDGHAHRVSVAGNVHTLRTRIVHDDRKDFRRFVERQKRYMREEAVKLRTASWGSLPASGKIRRLLIAPVAVVVHTLFVKGLILDGCAGFAYAWERFVAEVILARELLRG